jgi:hypothetical protein
LPGPLIALGAMGCPLSGVRLEGTDKPHPDAAGRFTRGPI